MSEARHDVDFAQAVHWRKGQEGRYPVLRSCPQRPRKRDSDERTMGLGLTNSISIGLLGLVPIPLDLVQLGKPGDQLGDALRLLIGQAGGGDGYCTIRWP